MGEDKEWMELESQLQHYHLSKLSDDFDPPLTVRRALGNELAEVIAVMWAHRLKVLDGNDVSQMPRSAWYLLYRVLKIEADLRDFRMRFRPKGITGSREIANDLEVIGRRMEAHVHRARDEGSPFFALRSLWFLAYAALRLRALTPVGVYMGLTNAGPDETMLKGINVRAELSGSKGQIDPTRPTERIQNTDQWPELETYRTTYIHESLVAPAYFDLLRDKLVEIIELMRAHMRKVDVAGDALEAPCTGWLLLCYALELEAQKRRFRMRFKRGVITSSRERGRELAEINRRMVVHLKMAQSVEPDFSELSYRSLWFLAYAAIKLRALDSQYVDMSLVPWEEAPDIDRPRPR